MGSPRPSEHTRPPAAPAPAPTAPHTAPGGPGERGHTGGPRARDAPQRPGKREGEEPEPPVWERLANFGTCRELLKCQQPPAAPRGTLQASLSLPAPTPTHATGLETSLWEGGHGVPVCKQGFSCPPSREGTLRRAPRPSLPAGPLRAHRPPGPRRLPARAPPVPGVDPAGLLGVVVDVEDFAVVIPRLLPAIG